MPGTTHHGGVSVHQHGEGSVGREAWQQHSPRPTALQELKPRSPHSPRGSLSGIWVEPSRGAQRVWDPQWWVPEGGSIEEERKGADRT